MPETKQDTPVRVGLLIVTISYFLFTLHALFTTQWIGEWNRITGTFNFYVFITDIAALPGLVLRFVASIIAVGAVIFYFSKPLPPISKTYKILRLILVFEAIYWLSLVVTTVVSIPGLFSHSVTFVLTSLAISVIPLIAESIVLPISLLVLAWKLNPNKPVQNIIKWSLISGSVFIFVFWLTNTSMWLVTLQVKGTHYLTAYPGNLLSFILTAFGLLALAIYATIFAAQSTRVQSLQELKLRTAGAIILSLGMYFLWNYLTWVFFNYPWSDWYAWFLGHNLDLWLLSLPLLGLPLIFTKRRSKEPAENLTP